MQTPLIAGLRPADQAPPSRDDQPASTAFSSVLGSLFATFPAGQTPAVAREAGPAGRPAPGRDVADAQRPGGADGRTSPAQEARPEVRTPVEQAVNPRSPQDVVRQDRSPSPVDAPASQAGNAVRSAGDRSITPSDFAVPSSPGSAAPVLPADGNLVAPPGLPAVAAPQGLETAPGTRPELAPSPDVPVSTGVAVAAPGSPAVPVPAAPAVAAGDASVSAPTPTADSRPSAVPAPGPQAGPAAPALRTAKTDAPLEPSSVERVAAAVKAQASLGGGRVKLLLHPPHLGAVRIEVAVRDGVVFARMEADSQSARHSLQQHSNDLRQSLEDQGLTLGRLSVSVSQGDGNGSEAHFGSSPSSFFGESATGIDPDPVPEARIPRLLDVTV